MKVGHRVKYVALTTIKIGHTIETFIRMADTQVSIECIEDGGEFRRICLKPSLICYKHFRAIYSITSRRHPPDLMQLMSGRSVVRSQHNVCSVPNYHSTSVD